MTNDYIKRNSRLIRFKPVISFSAEFISGLWNLKELNKGFKHGIKLIDDNEDINTKSPEQVFIIMMKIGGQVVKILFTDPLLPDSYMPGSWKANDLRIKFSSFMKKTKEASRSFWEKVI